MLIVLPLLTLNMPVFIALIYLGVVAYINLHNTRHGRNSVLGRLEERIRNPIWQVDPGTREAAARCKSLRRKNGKNTISDGETDELYQVVGQLLLAGPKPQYDLRQYRLDIAAWMAMLVYTLFRLQEQFPEVVARLLGN